MIPNATWLIHDVFLSRPAVTSSYVNDKSGRTRWGYVCMYVMWVGIPVVYRAILPTFVRWPMLPPGVPR